MNFQLYCSSCFVVIWPSQFSALSPVHVYSMDESDRFKSKVRSSLANNRIPFKLKQSNENNNTLRAHKCNETKRIFIAAFFFISK